MDDVVASKVAVLVKLGLKEGKAKEVATSKDDQYGALVALLAGAGLWPDCDEVRGALIFQVLAKIKSPQHRPLVTAFVASRKIDTAERLDAAAALTNARGAAPITDAELERACGVGLVYTEAQIAERVEAECAAKAPSSAGELLGRVKKALPFSDSAAVKRAVDQRMAAVVKAAVVVEEKKPTTTTTTTTTTVPSASSKKTKKKKALKAALPPIVPTAESVVALVLAGVRRNEATGEYECDAHAVAMVADSLAAVQRSSYAAALRAGAVDPRNGVQLPPAKYMPQ